MDADNVKMGVCTVSFNGVDLGYTKGGVKCSYGSESTEITVDQSDAPVGERMTKQTFEVRVPMAEANLTILASLLPGASLITDGTKKTMVLTGDSGVDLLSTAKALLLTPVDGVINDSVYVHYAVPVPKIEFGYEKDNVRVYEVTFKALKGDNGFVKFGDPTAVGISGVYPVGGATAGGTAVTISGTGFTGATGAKFATTAATSFVVVSDNTITCVSPSGTGSVAVAVTKAGADKAKASAFTYA